MRCFLSLSVLCAVWDIDVYVVGDHFCLLFADLKRSDWVKKGEEPVGRAGSHGSARLSLLLASQFGGTNVLYPVQLLQQYSTSSRVTREINKGCCHQERCALLVLRES